MVYHLPSNIHPLPVDTVILIYPVESSTQVLNNLSQVWKIIRKMILIVLFYLFLTYLITSTTICSACLVKFT